MKEIRRLMLVVFLSSLLAGCNLPSVPTSTQVPTPTQIVISDSFFEGQALLDFNRNGQIDSEDTPVENATFIVTLQGGTEFGEITNELGNAFIIIPGDVEYPVTMRMEAPKDSTLKLIGPPSITFSPPSELPKFLFSK